MRLPAVFLREHGTSGSSALSGPVASSIKPDTTPQQKSQGGKEIVESCDSDQAGWSRVMQEANCTS